MIGVDPVSLRLAVLREGVLGALRVVGLTSVSESEGMDDERGCLGMVCVMSVRWAERE
jgi:hypothetical protein